MYSTLRERKKRDVGICFWLSSVFYCTICDFAGLLLVLL